MEQPKKLLEQERTHPDAQLIHRATMPWASQLFMVYYLPTPYDAFGAGRALMDAMDVVPKLMV